jgi:hypothetical protein
VTFQQLELSETMKPLSKKCVLYVYEYQHRKVNNMVKTTVMQEREVEENWWLAKDNSSDQSKSTRMKIMFTVYELVS